ncbi:isocitrate lyase/phosphoenolpyruvate mutase family protein [Epidermidibacterium keratini]|uniref:Isocitrate lyase/phosphoenolpyruvate mutase family protein n=1 Tax=Epidermidibacterium keratini TaxID=1891644 RepID=A0A7L4YKQ7_9ACTN|nr:isocitrate lyase/phosphoenolpyruvate mutase family protein [Epidermidibacterium keratini]QHB99785.1 isocitrate lyase/phosphoenolpyruvate mutase family protein [Epidermidibacterium keratini]
MTFAELHRPGDPLILPNAWDVGTAKALARAGFAAIGTTSLGLAAAQGLLDATQVTRRLTIELAQRLRESKLGVFVTCDLEDGFSDDPAAIADLVAELGVDGVNIEDATSGELVDPRQHAAKITAIKRACPDVFVNARTDVFWLGGTDRVAATDRARAYVDAGADGIFVPGVDDLDVLEPFINTISSPINVLASAQVSAQEFAEVGVARISTGSLLYRVALTSAVNAAELVRRSAQIPTAIGYDEVQTLNS